MKHKHSEVIKAFVDSVECEYQQCDNWFEIYSLQQFDIYEFVRIKPEPPKEKEQEPVLWVHIKTLDRTIRQGTSGAFWHKFPDGYGLSKEEFIPIYTQLLKKAREK